MVSKHLLARLRTLTQPASYCSRPSYQCQTRRYSDHPQPSPPAPPSTPPPVSNSPTKSSLNETELKKFASISDTWWDAEGPFKALHAMNPTRLAFIRSTLCRHFGKDPYAARPFEGLKFVDVGCGGGILSEPLARMGASVTGIDAVDKNIKVAQLHADSDPITSSIDYRCTTAEELVEEQRKFDAVLALEVIEHVAEPADFCKSLSALTSSGGATLISTINRSMRAYATAIFLAENVLHWLPKGTHEWSSFLTPEELVLILQRYSISVQEMAGLVYSPLTRRWTISDDIGLKDDDTEKKTNRTSQGRRKIEIKKIEKLSSRQVTFSKRRVGLFKKASELCILTGAQIAIIVRSHGNRVFSFGHPKCDAVIERFLKGEEEDCAPEGDYNYGAYVCRELEVKKKRGEEYAGLWWCSEVEGKTLEELEEYAAALEELRKNITG